MKGLMGLPVIIGSAVLAFALAAQAKPAPLDPQPVPLTAVDTAVNTGPAGAMLEADYFRAPQPPFAVGRVFPCRLQLRIFEKTRIAQTCN